VRTNNDPTTQHALISHRPTGGVAGVILFYFLNLNPHKGMTLQQHSDEFDFAGLGLLIGGTVCVLIGLNSGETSCVSDQPSRQSCSND
jgi:hypothetical protein